MSEQLERGEPVTDLHSTFLGGIRKILYYCSISKETFVTVEDDFGPNFTVDVPKPLPEGKTPMWYFDHAMLFSPEVAEQRKLYAATEDSQHGNE